MKVKTIFIICIMALVILQLGTLVVSCQQSKQTPTAEEITQAAIDTIAELDTYQCDIELVMAYDTNEEKLTMQGEMNSRCDNINKNMYWVWKINFRQEDEPFNPSDAYIDENYMVDGRGYEKSSSDDTWHKSRGLTEYYEQIWEEQNIMERQLDLLTLLSPVILQGYDTINGVECYKLQLEPERDTLWECIQKEEMIFFDQALEGLDYSQNIVSEYTIFLWVTKDAYFLVKTTEDYILTDNVGTITYNETVLIYDVNEPVNIELPPEAEP